MLPSLALQMLVCLFLLPCLGLAQGPVFNGFTCPLFDRGEHDLRSVTVRSNGPMTCDYTSGASCAYFGKNGSQDFADSDDGDDLCLDELQAVSAHSTYQDPPVFKGFTCQPFDQEESNLESVTILADDSFTCDYASGAACAYSGNDGSQEGADSVVCPNELKEVSTQSTHPDPTTAHSTTTLTVTTTSSSSLETTTFQITSSSSIGSSSSPSITTTSSTGVITATMSTGIFSSTSVTTSGEARQSSTINGLPSNGKQTSVRAVAGSVAGFGLLAGLILFMLVLKRYRARIKQRRDPEQFRNLEARNSVIRPMQEKHENPATAAPSSNLTSGAPESNVVMEDGVACDETLTLRMRRMEAQLETLLAMGLPEDTPPSYGG